MADEVLAELLKTQKSLTEWLEDIKHKDAAMLRREDNEKRERLRTLNEIIGLPFDKPTQFTAAELRDDNPAFKKFLKERGDELCALRLIPTEGDLPKLRMRGKSIRDVYAWFKEQDIDPAKYRADFIPHPSDYSWATIFIVNQYGIQGEIIFGGHHLLTQGFHEDQAPSIFRYDFETWSITPPNGAALAHLEKISDMIHVPDKAKQKELTEKLGVTFAHDYIQGYFETTDSSLGTWYIDYSPSLGKLYADVVFRTETVGADAVSDKQADAAAQSGLPILVRGQTGSPGKATGDVCVVPPDNLDIDFPAGGVLVCEVTTPNYVPLMQKASAIVTDMGGILSHAAIVARELHKPCIVGTGDATRELTDGNKVRVDADEGTVRAA